MTPEPAAHVSMPVAIVGIGCRFPGGVTDPSSFWRLLVEGRDAIAEIPGDRIDLAHYFDPRPATPGRMMTRWGGFLDRIDEFDAMFFGVSPREAERMDPQQRLLLETAWEALEDAGQDVSRLEGSATGVFVGQWLSDFEARLFVDPEAVDFYMTTGSGRYAASGRISYALGLRGPSLTLDTACSSSLAAVHLAARSIRSGESTLALAGGVNVILQPHISVAYSQSRMMAPDGHCKFGDAKGDGYVRSEGAALVVLKPLQQAIASGDRVYAVIRGSALNNDGNSSGSMGTPSRVGQEELLRSAYRDAGLPAGRVGYIEAHGTGTRAGDPVELGALGAVLGEGRATGQRAFVGSVKTNIGHTEGAAGVAGLVKVALALDRGAIPPSLHCTELNPAIPWAGAPFEIPRDEPKSWPETGGPRVGGVSAFGIAGTNAHIVLEQAPTPRVGGEPSEPSRATALLVLSTKCPEALRALAGRYADLLAADGAPALQDVCRSAVTRRTALPQRAAFIAADAPAMVQALRAYSAGEPATAEGVATGGEVPKLAFVVPGQGAQWTGMARELMAREPAFRVALQRCDEAARRWADWSIVEQLALDPAAPGYRLDQIDVIQPVLVALAIGYAELWRSLGIEPDAVVGHSMGEVGAAYIAGVLDLDQAMRIICRRSALMRRTSGKGAMALVELSMDEARERIRGCEAQISVAVSNSPRSSVISGEPQAVQQLMTELERDQVFCRLVKVDVASHSPQMDEPAEALARELAGMTPQPAQVAIHSTVLARLAEGREFDAVYWGNNLRQPVHFAECIAELVGGGTTSFIELGPHPVLTASIAQTAQSRGASAVALACGRREEPEQAAALAVVAGLWVAGHGIDWSKLMPPCAPVDLPSYPWQRERHWVREATMGDARLRVGRPVQLVAAHQAWLHQLRWEAAEAAPEPSGMRGGAWIVMSDGADEAEPLLAALRAAGVQASWSSMDRFDEALREIGDGRQLRGVASVVADREGVAFNPVSTLQATSRVFGASEGVAHPKLWWITTGAQVVAGRARPRVAVHAGALWGAARVVAEEHPEHWGGLIDLDPSDDPQRQAAILVRELLGADRESQLALRDGECFVLRLQALSAEPIEVAPVAWRADSSYLITGGLGELGLQIAAAMVAQGARRLVLMGRHGLPPRVQWNDRGLDARTGQRIAAVRALEAAGASVRLLVADMTEAAQVERALGDYAAESWPVIRGVIHAAGITENQLALQADRGAFDRVLAPKLAGALRLDRMLPELDCFVMFSSISALLGAPGMANYAAANAGLDALAADRRARGVPALSIQWGPWEGMGLFAGDAARQNMDELRRQGIECFTPEQGVAIFTALAGYDDASITVMPVDWSALAAARRGRDLRLYSGRGPIGAGRTGVPGSLAARLAQASVPERRNLLELVVREAVGKVLKLAPARIDALKPLGGMGLGSLLAMELRNRLEAALARPLSATLAWNYPTVQALVGFLAGEANPDALTPRNNARTGASASAPASASASPSTSEAIGALAQLSDDEAAQLLRGKR